MVAELMAFSGMNMAFAKSCVEQNQWDLEKAKVDFVTLNQGGKIPAEAFMK